MHGEVGLTLVDFGFMSHFSVDAAGGTTPSPIPRPGPLSHSSSGPGWLCYSHRATELITPPGSRFQNFQTLLEQEPQTPGL